VQLIRDLSPGQAPSLRIGGDTTDWTWWPVPGVANPHGVRYTLTPRWVRVTGALARDLGARLILGINLEIDSARVASAEARALIDGIGRSSIVGLEPGNEPELYGSFYFYSLPDGKPATGRPSGYNITDYLRDFSQIAGSLPNVPLVGPATGGPRWIPELPAFLAAQPRVRVATLHKYPLQTCFISPAQPQYPTIAHFLAPVASRGLADSVAASVRAAHARHVALRIDEMNSDSCGRAPGVSNAFASALWALDAVFAIAGAGADGVNVHTFPGAAYQLFTIGRRGGRWWGSVRPEYYGLMMFARAAPAGARLVDVRLSGSTGVRAWATAATGGQERVVLINDDTAARHVAVIRLTGPASPGLRTTATIERLRATSGSATATAGVTLGARSFGRRTWTGILTPVPSALEPSSDGYTVALPPASAALVTVANR
jgi:hypothetical protein